jgi:hypothetical protein
MGLSGRLNTVYEVLTEGPRAHNNYNISHYCKFRTTSQIRLPSQQYPHQVTFLILLYCAK